jgi:hypothetical protein
MQDFAGETEGKKILERPMRRWEDNIKCIFKKWDRVIGWIYLALNRDR